MLTLLADSIALNVEKGSSLWLAVNRRPLDALARAVIQTQGPEAERLRNAVSELEHRLAQAKSVRGRVVLPGEEGEILELPEPTP